MPWVELVAVFAVSHLVGDFLLQTEWQARRKHGGLGPDPEARRALVAHVVSYTTAFVPAFVWIGVEIGVGTALGTAAAVALPHLIQDDARLLRRYIRAVKHVDPLAQPGLFLLVDQTAHIVALLATALVVGDGLTT